MSSSNDFVDQCLEDVAPLPGWLNRNMRMLSTLDHRAASIALHVERKKKAYLKCLKDGKRLEKKCRKAAAAAADARGAADNTAGTDNACGGSTGLLSVVQPCLSAESLNYKRRQQQYEALVRRCEEELADILQLERRKRTLRHGMIDLSLQCSAIVRKIFFDLQTVLRSAYSCKKEKGGHHCAGGSSTGGMAQSAAGVSVSPDSIRMSNTGSVVDDDRNNAPACPQKYNSEPNNFTSNNMQQQQPSTAMQASTGTDNAASGAVIGTRSTRLSTEDNHCEDVQNSSFAQQTSVWPTQTSKIEVDGGECIVPVWDDKQAIPRGEHGGRQGNDIVTQNNAVASFVAGGIGTSTGTITNDSRYVGSNNSINMSGMSNSLLMRPKSDTIHSGGMANHQMINDQSSDALIALKGAVNDRHSFTSNQHTAGTNHIPPVHAPSHNHLSSIPDANQQMYINNTWHTGFSTNCINPVPNTSVDVNTGTGVNTAGTDTQRRPLRISLAGGIQSRMASTGNRAPVSMMSSNGTGSVSMHGGGVHNTYGHESGAQGNSAGRSTGLPHYRHASFQLGHPKSNMASAAKSSRSEIESMQGPQNHTASDNGTDTFIDYGLRNNFTINNDSNSGGITGVIPVTENGERGGSVCGSALISGRSVTANKYSCAVSADNSGMTTKTNIVGGPTNNGAGVQGGALSNTQVVGRTANLINSTLPGPLQTADAHFNPQSRSTHHKEDSTTTASMHLGTPHNTTTSTGTNCIPVSSTGTTDKSITDTHNSAKSKKHKKDHTGAENSLATSSTADSAKKKTGTGASTGSSKVDDGVGSSSSTAGTGNVYWEGYSGSGEFICPVCRGAGDDQMLVACDGCDAWFHCRCVGYVPGPDEEDDNEDWFCSLCRKS